MGYKPVQNQPISDRISDITDITSNSLGEKIQVDDNINVDDQELIKRIMRQITVDVAKNHSVLNQTLNVKVKNTSDQ